MMFCRVASLKHALPASIERACNAIFIYARMDHIVCVVDSNAID